jgi:antitoxin component YwqK of YwqJK toxin-antitoxin module
LAKADPQSPLFSYYESLIVDNVSVKEYDADGNPILIELFSNGKLAGRKWIQYEDGNVKNIKTEYVPPPLEWWYV